MKNEPEKKALYDKCIDLHDACKYLYRTSNRLRVDINEQYRFYSAKHSEYSSLYDKLNKKPYYKTLGDKITIKNISIDDTFYDNLLHRAGEMFDDDFFLNFGISSVLGDYSMLSSYYQDLYSYYQDLYSYYQDLYSKYRIICTEIDLLSIKITSMRQIKAINIQFIMINILINIFALLVVIGFIYIYYKLILFSFQSIR